MAEYEHKKIEEKWRTRWVVGSAHATGDDPKNPKCYVLDEFPYPSGEGLHVGHTRIYTASDVYARKKRMDGFNVLHPMGWDAFGLPAEQFAIKHKVHPSDSVKKNTERFKEQMQRLALSYDWDREINTTEPEYYKWTQWIFLKLYERGLAYQSFEPINWCPTCQTGLANEDLEGGNCERCGTPVEKKPMRQWVLRITEYADRLVDDLDRLPWSTAIKDSQKNWIGRSVGVEFDFALENIPGQKDGVHRLTVFTTRPDTICGATYIAISAELARSWIDIGWKADRPVADLIEKILGAERSRERDDVPEKEGIDTGIRARNPATGQTIPVWIANYVLSGYGTGAIMAVPAHDERDWEFAKKYALPISAVIWNAGDLTKEEAATLSGGTITNELLSEISEYEKRIAASGPYTESGILVNSGDWTGKRSEEAGRLIAEMIGGRPKTQYKLRDWVFSRQRYWGEPIPVVHDPSSSGRKQRALILHGFEASGEWAWVPWMARELRERGFEVETPSMPEPAHPELSRWLSALKDPVKRLGPGDIVVAHSLGSKAILHALLKEGVHVEQIFLVGSALGEIRDRDWSEVEKRLGERSDIPALKRFWEAEIDLERIGVLAKKITLIISDDDRVVPRRSRECIPKSWEFLVWSGFKHFSDPVQEKLRDLILTSRKEAGVYPVDPSDLPVILPSVDSYAPTGTGESPLAGIKEWVEVEGYITERGTFKLSTKADLPSGATLRRFLRETNTMPQWAGSSWYYLRYIDPHNAEEIVAKDKERYWSPVDVYVGGAEHVTRHLIYARFWHKFLYDIGVVGTVEPFERREGVGLVLGEGGVKMSKRLGNVINPDDIIERFGADSLRVYEMFMGPFGAAIAWSTDNLIGARRFIERTIRIVSQKLSSIDGSDDDLTTLYHQSVDKVGKDIEHFHFNTAISQLMILGNALEKAESVDKEHLEGFVKLLAPFAPYVSEELWEMLGHKTSVHHSLWPACDPKKLVRATSTIAVQVNGKLRDTITVPRDISEEDLVRTAKERPDVVRWIGAGAVRRVIVVSGRTVNFVVA